MGSPDWVGNFASTSSEPSKNGSQMPLVPKPSDGLDGLDAKKRTQSNGRHCRQCNGTPDGTEQEFIIDGQYVWLHDQCEPYWRDGDGWGRRR